MELRRTIQAALEITRTLTDELRAGNLMGCASLLDDREAVLAVFAETHRKATATDRETCRVLLEELVGADEDLQDLGRNSLAEASRDRHRPGGGVSDRQPVSACFDRKA